MLHSIRTDESLQILIFVCLPLLLLLVVVIALMVRSSRTTATFPDFSVAISKVSQCEAYAVYRDGSKQVEFSAHVIGGKWFKGSQIIVRLPRELPDESAHDIVPRLVLGFKKLRYQYLVYRPRVPETIPEAERGAAIVKLRKMGIGTKNHRVSGKEASARISEVRDLMRTATGIRESIEVFDRSDSFVDHV